jgi:hypothetical protein
LDIPLEVGHCVARQSREFSVGGNVRNTICALGIILAMGLGTTAAATNAFKTQQKEGQRKVQTKPRQPRELKGPAAPPVTYEERTIPAPAVATPAQKDGLNKGQPPTKQLSRLDRRQA